MVKEFARQLAFLCSFILVAPMAAAQSKPKSETSQEARAGKKATKTTEHAKAGKKVVKPTTNTANQVVKKSNPIVEINTTLGNITVELNAQKAPISTQNFLNYVNDKFYDHTLFHRVIDKFMIQGGGFEIKDKRIHQKPTQKPIANEAKNGLKNDRGTIAMARTSDPNSATSQFFINHVHNHNLNYPKPDGHGYAVFGQVIKGMDVVDKIAKVKTTTRFGMGDFPEKDIMIESIRVVK